VWGWGDEEEAVIGERLFVGMKVGGGFVNDGVDGIGNGKEFLK
jgi:hypothetical protein